MGTAAFFDRSSHRLRRNPSVAQARQLPLQGSLKRCNRYASLVKGDSPQCREMSRSDRGDGHRLGGGFAVGKLGGIDALATKQSPGLFLPNADAFGARVSRTACNSLGSKPPPYGFLWRYGNRNAVGADSIRP